MKIGLLKISGKTIDEFISTEFWTNSISYLKNLFDGIIIVHGGGKIITEWAEKLGHESEFVDGQRVTSSGLLEVVAAVQSGLINSKLTAKLNSSNIEAIGLSGIDRNTFTANYINNKLGFVGKPELTGSIDWIYKLLNQNVIPVFSSVCKDSKGNLMNVNADIFTEVLALSINADTVFFVSDIKGVKINNKVKSFLNEEEINSGINSGDITDGMIPKLLSCVELLNKGISNIWIGSKLCINNAKEKNKKYECGTWITTSNKKHEFLSVA